MAFGSKEWSCFSIVSLETLFGAFINVFIILRFCFTYWKHKNVSGYEKIIAALSVSNLCITCLTFINILIFFIWPVLMMTTHIYSALYILSFFVILTSAWLTASLCFYYYVKIKTFSSDFLSRLKTKMNSLASWMIVVSVLLSLLCSSLLILPIIKPIKHTVNSSMLNNTLWQNTSFSAFDNNFNISFFSSVIPFFISVTTTASMTWSLHLHKVKMVRNQTSFTNGNVERYEGAIKIMICMLIFYALMYVTMCLFFFNIADPNSPGFWGLLFIACAYSPLQSILLSLSTSKLKRAWVKMFNCNAQSSDGDENRDE